MKTVLILLISLSLCGQLSSKLAVLGSKALIDRIHLYRKPSKNKKLMLPFRIIANTGHHPLWPPIKAIVVVENSNINGCSKVANAEPSKYYPHIPVFQLVNFQGPCKLHEKVRIAQEKGYSGLIEGGAQDLRFSNSSSKRLSESQQPINIPVILLGGRDASSMMLMAYPSSRSDFGEVIVEYGYKVNRSSSLTIDFLMGMDNKESLQSLKSLNLLLKEHSDLNFTFNAVFYMTGCNTCSEAGVKKYCIEVQGREYCVKHSYKSVTGLASAVLVHSLLMSMEDFDYLNYLDKYLEDCVSKVESQEPVNLHKCSKSILQDGDLTKLQTALQNSTMYSHPKLVEYMYFIEKHKKSQQNSLWINGRHLRGDLSGQNIMQGICGSVVKPPASCSKYVRRWPSLKKIRSLLKKYDRKNSDLFGPFDFLVVVFVFCVTLGLLFIIFKTKQKKLGSESFPVRVIETSVEIEPIVTERSVKGDDSTKES